MKFGALGFSYTGFDNFAQSLQAIGYYTGNLGDNAQTIAARRAWRSVGIDEQDIIMIDRDTLPAYTGPPAAVLMNAVFTSNNLPTPEAITPIFLGFCADATVISKHSEWLRRHAPIGCRDPQTAAHCEANGIPSFVTGCVTLTLPPRSAPPSTGRLFIVLGWPGLLPPSVLKHVPSHLLDRAEFINHRQPHSSFPLSIQEQRLNEALELHILKRYREEASLVLTPLLHVASPCVSMQVPVVLCRLDRDSRFGMLESLMPIYTPDRVSEIDWSPGIPDVSMIARGYLDHLSQWVKRLGSPEKE